MQVVNLGQYFQCQVIYHLFVITAEYSIHTGSIW